MSAGNERLPVCHYTNSETNEYVVITISEKAYSKHADEHGDVPYNTETGECETEDDEPPFEPPDPTV